MAVTQKTVVLNDFGLARRERTSARGSTGVRYTVSIDAQPLVHVFDAKTLGAGPATAIAELYRARIQDISASAAPATMLKRKYDEASLERGEAHAVRRYSGGRTGLKAPGRVVPEGRLFNSSGRLAEGIVAGPTRDNQWVINVPANRFDPSTFADREAGLVRMVDKLRELVPEFGNGAATVAVPEVRQAIGDSLDRIFLGGLGRSYSHAGDLRAGIRAAQMDAIRQALDLARTIGFDLGV